MRAAAPAAGGRAPALAAAAAPAAAVRRLPPRAAARPSRVGLAQAGTAATSAVACAGAAAAATRRQRRRLADGLLAGAGGHSRRLVLERSAAIPAVAAPAPADTVAASVPGGTEWRSWAEKLGVAAPKVELHTFNDAFGGELRGMVARDGVESDEPLICVPAQHALQTTTGGDCPLGDEVDPSCWRAMPWWAQLAVLLVRESQRGEESPLASWVASLPRDFATVPLGWSDAELEMLEYPALVERVRRQRRELERAHAAAAAGCRFELAEADFRWAVLAVRSRAFSGPYEGRGPSDRLAQLGLIALLLAGGVASGQLQLEDGLNGALVAALAIPMTDFFVGQSAKLKRHVVCPVVDYLNHDSNAASDIAYEYFSNEFAVRVRGGFKEGEQACINYGERRSNDALLQYYGFVERDCPHDVYCMDLLKHLDPEAAAAGSTLMVELSRTGPDEKSMTELCRLLASDGGESPSSATTEALAWKAVAVACEAELQRLPAGEAHELAMGAPGPAGAAARFRAEKEKVLLACRAHAEARRGRRSSAAPLSLAARAAVVPSFQAPAAWRHAWAEGALQEAHAAALAEDGFCVLPGAFEPELARRCLAECEALDAAAGTTVTTNRCNRGSRSAWLEFASEEEREALRQQLPALTELSERLAGLPARAESLGALDGQALRVHPATMIAVYPERAAEYALHKDSYAPGDNDPATGATRRLTILAYFNDWREGDGGELRLHEDAGGRPDPRRFRAAAPSAGSVVAFDSRRCWHAVAPALRGPRWAATLWVH